ncbi:MAG: ABC-type transport auxiliary lipoprotein family protein [Sulfuricella sp.]
MGCFNENGLARKITALLCALALAGCTGLRPAETGAARTYLLEAQFDRAEQIRPIPITLVVSMPRAAAGYDTARMAYVRQPHLLEYFAKNRWADAPAKMLGPLLVRALEQRAGFRAVAPATGMVKGDIRLDTELILLQQDFSTSPSRLHLILRAQLVEEASRQVLATRVFEAYEDTPSDDPYGGVVGANRALPRLLVQIADFSAAQGVQNAGKNLRSYSE